MMSKQRIRLAVTAAAVMTTVMAAAACSSSGKAGGAAGTGLDLKTVGAAQAVETAARAAAARHTVHIHATTSGKDFTQTIDGAKGTDQFRENVTVDSVVTGATDHVRGEILGDGKTVFLDDPGIPSEERSGKTWVELDLAHPPSAGTGSPGTPSSSGGALFAALAVVYAHDDPGPKFLFLLAFPDLHRVGIETKDGRQALHVAGSAAPDSLTAPPAGSGLTQDYLDFRRQQAKNASTTKISIDLWIGADGLPIESAETDTCPNGDTSGDEVMSQWGANLSVPEPPAADVYLPPAA